MTPTVSLTGTRGDIAVAYRKAFFGPLALTLHVAVLGIFILGILSVEHEVAFIEAALLYIFSLGVAHRFLHEVLSADRVITAGDLREALDADLLSHVRKPSAATAFDLLLPPSALVTARSLWRSWVSIRNPFLKPVTMLS